MHSYLRAIGFSEYKTSKIIKDLLDKSMHNGEIRKISEDEEAVFGSIGKAFSESLGLYLFGEYDDNDEFKLEYYYPYLDSSYITTNDMPIVEKSVSKESYYGVCEDLKVGVSIIFSLQNTIEFKNELNASFHKSSVDGVIFTGMSVNGKILFPIKKNERQKKNTNEAINKRMNLIAAAKNGDEEAIENLTLDDIDTYSMVSRRILNEDIFSIVETYFMPYGIECDMYSILGDIVDLRKETNIITKEEIYILTLNCNDLVFDVCINKVDLLGEPAIGRRFKGSIWLQGKIQFSNI